MPGLIHRHGKCRIRSLDSPDRVYEQEPGIRSLLTKMGTGLIKLSTGIKLP